MSSTKKLIKPYPLISAGDMSGNITGSEVVCENQDYAMVLVEWTGTSPVGEFKMEFVQLDATRNNGVDVWEPMDFGSTIAISGNTGSHQIVFQELPFMKIRPKYAYTSGIGSLTVTFMAKEG